MKRIIAFILFIYSLSSFAENKYLNVNKKNGDVTSYRIQDVDSISFDSTYMSNKAVRILHIGNSFTTDATSYLKEITTNSNSDVSNIALYSLTRSSASFKNWIDCWNDKETSIYAYKKILGGIDCQVEGDNSLIDSTHYNPELFHNI